MRRGFGFCGFRLFLFGIASGNPAKFRLLHQKKAEPSPLGAASSLWEPLNPLWDFSFSPVGSFRAKVGNLSVLKLILGMAPASLELKEGAGYRKPQHACPFPLSSEEALRMLSVRTGYLCGPQLSTPTSGFYLSKTWSEMHPSSRKFFLHCNRRQTVTPEVCLDSGVLNFLNESKRKQR